MNKSEQSIGTSAKAEPVDSGKPEIGAKRIKFTYETRILRKSRAFAEFVKRHGRTVIG